jgi:dTMP kinase
MSRGKFITLEGLDGAGKTTHLAWLAEFLKTRGMPVRLTREPGGTALGERLRELLLAPAQDLDAETETLLVFAARREHVDKVIEAALAAGSWVVCDRFTDATFAYQSGGSGVAWSKIELLEHWVQGTLQPDLTLYFDIPPELGRVRTSAIKATADRFEQEDAGFHARVREAYLRRAREHPQRIRVIDASRGLSEVHEELERTMDAFFGASAACKR